MLSKEMPHEINVFVTKERFLHSSSTEKAYSTKKTQVLANCHWLKVSFRTDFKLLPAFKLLHSIALLCLCHLRCFYSSARILQSIFQFFSYAPRFYFIILKNDKAFFVAVPELCTTLLCHSVQKDG